MRGLEKVIKIDWQGGGINGGGVAEKVIKSKHVNLVSLLLTQSYYVFEIDCNSFAKSNVNCNKRIYMFFHLAHVRVGCQKKK